MPFQLINKHRNFYSLGLLLLLGTLWGTGYSIARFAMTNGIHPLGYSFWQSLGPAIIILLLCLYNKDYLKFDKAHLSYYVFCGLIGIALPNTIMYFAAPHLPAGILALTVNTVPIFTYPLALALRAEAFSWRRVLGIGSAIIGVSLIVLPRSQLTGIEMSYWALISLISPLCFACCSIYIARKRPQHSNALPLTAGMLILSSILLSPLVIASGHFHPISASLPLTDKVILLEIALSSLGYVLFFQLIKMAGPVFYSLVDSIVVVTGLFWGYILFGESLNRWTLIAVYFILMALILVTKPVRKSAELNLAANDKIAT